MGLMDQLTEGVAVVAREAQKVIEQGKVKVEELQVERRMDVAARKLGYLELDRSRGRAADDSAREDLLQQLAALEDELAAARNANTEAQATAPAPDAATPDAPAPDADAPDADAPDADVPTPPPTAGD